MPLQFNSPTDFHWDVREIAVVGSGIVGMPMAAHLGHTQIRERTRVSTKVVEVQRDSRTSGWNGAATNVDESVMNLFAKA